MKKQIDYDFSAVTILYLTVVATTSGYARFYEDGKLLFQATQGSPSSSAFTYDPNAVYSLEFNVDLANGGILFEKDGRINIGIYGDGGGFDWNSGTGHHWVYYRWTTPEVTPTYLETLDKLDQWSSAQYTPSRNKLNL